MAPPCPSPRLLPSFPGLGILPPPGPSPSAPFSHSEQFHPGARVRRPHAPPVQTRPPDGGGAGAQEPTRAQGGAGPHAHVPRPAQAQTQWPERNQVGGRTAAPGAGLLRQQLGGASYGRAHCPQLPSRHWSAGVEAGAAAAAFGHGKTRVSQRGGRGHCSPPQEQALCWGQVAWAPRGAAPCSGADQDMPRLCRDHAETTTPDSHAGQVPVRGTWEARAVSESPSPLCDTSQKSHSSPSHAPSQAALRTLPGSWFVPGESPPTVKALESPGNSQGPRRGAWRPRGPRPAPQQDGDMPRAREDEGKACRSSSGHLSGQDWASREWTDTRHRLAVGTQHLSDNSEQTSHRVTPSHTHTEAGRVICQIWDNLCALKSHDYGWLRHTEDIEIRRAVPHARSHTAHRSQAQPPPTHARRVRDALPRPAHAAAGRTDILTPLRHGRPRGHHVARNERSQRDTRGVTHTRPAGVRPTEAGGRRGRRGLGVSGDSLGWDDGKSWRRRGRQVRDDVA